MQYLRHYNEFYKTEWGRRGEKMVKKCRGKERVLKERQIKRKGKNTSYEI
jgi:hypothetical protein